MKKRSRGKAKAKNGSGEKRNGAPKRTKSSIATSQVKEDGGTQPSGNGSKSLEVVVNHLSEMVLQRTQQMRVRVRGIVQSIQILVAHAQLEYGSFQPPTYILTDIDNDLQLIFVQEQGEHTQPLGDGAKQPNLSNGAEDGAALSSLNDRIDRIWNFSLQFEGHMDAFLRWSNQWLLVIATHQNLDLTRIAPSAAEFLTGMENAF